MSGVKRRPERVGELLPQAARELGLDAEYRLARAIATWDALIAERVPPAVGACRLRAVEGTTLVVETDEPRVAAELRLRATELLTAVAAAAGGVRATQLRLVGERGGWPAVADR